MTTPLFTEDEINGAVKSLKKSKSPGTDDIRAEHLKSGPKIVNENIARIYMKPRSSIRRNTIRTQNGNFSTTTETWKNRGPPSNLRPVILLSLLRKILAICLIRRIGQKIDDNIPLSQAAYRAGRGTTEQLLTIKLLAEKAITTPNYHTHLL